MQSVYAMIKSNDDDIVKEEKFIKFSIIKMFDLYVLLLSLLVEVQKLAEQKQEISKQKYLVTNDDLFPNRKFVENKLIKKIAESNSLSLHVEAQNLNNWSIDDEYVKIIWEKLRKSTLYSNYLSQDEDSFSIDKNDPVIAKICEMEKDILDKYRSSKTKEYKLSEQLEKNTVKIFSSKNNLQTIIIKISGLWESDTAYGLTYKFINY